MDPKRDREIEQALASLASSNPPETMPADVSARFDSHLQSLLAEDSTIVRSTRFGAGLSTKITKNKVVKKGLLEPLLANACMGKYQAEAASLTSTNSSSPSVTALTMSLTALARPSKIASAMPRAYKVTALEESSLPGIT